MSQLFDRQTDTGLQENGVLDIKQFQTKALFVTRVPLIIFTKITSTSVIRWNSMVEFCKTQHFSTSLQSSF